MNYIKQILYSGKIKNLLDLGNEHLEDENYFSAITYFSNALDINESCEEALFNRGKALIYTKDFSGAIADLENLIEINPLFNSESYLMLVKSELVLGNTSKAAEYADEYYQQNRDDIQAQYFTARTKYLNNDFDAALDLVDLIIMEHDSDFDLHYLRCLILFAEENFVSAILDINRAIEIDSLNGFAYNLRALINIQLFNYKEAVNDLDYAIRLTPQNAIYYFNKAKIQVKIGDLIDAKNSINKAIELDEKNKSFYMLKGELELLNENHNEALDAYSMAYELDNSDKDLLRKILNLSLYNRDYDRAKKDLNKIKGISPKDSDTYYVGAFIEYELGNELETLSNLEKAIEFDPELFEAIMQSGIIKLSLKKYAEAIEDFNLITEENSNYSKSCLYKAQAFMHMGKLEESEQELKKIGNNYTDTDYSLLSSHICYLKENYEDAEKHLQKYIQANSNNESVKIIVNLLKAKQRKLLEIEELHEFKYDDLNKRIAQIINGIVNFEKGQYYSANYRLTNISGLSSENLEIIKPLIDFAEEQIS